MSALPFLHVAEIRRAESFARSGLFQVFNLRRIARGPASNETSNIAFYNGRP